MILRIDFDSDTPIYVQIKNEIIEGIAKGQLDNGEELPSVRALAEDIGVNMHTVNKAYSFLKDEGYIKMDRRKGAIISLNLKYSQEKFVDSLREDFRYYMAQCVNRKISKTEVLNLINETLDLYTKGD